MWLGGRGSTEGPGGGAVWLGGGGSTEGPGSSVAGGRGGKHVHCHLLGSGIISTGTAACIFHVV